MSRNFSLDSITQTIFGGSRNNNLQYENRVIVTSNTTFVVPPNTKAIKFSAVGGGQAGAGTTAGPGGGYFEKSFYSPFTGLTTSFQLTVGSAGGNTVLADSAGTTIATAYGATAIDGSNPVGVGGTSSGGDFNANGSPGGTSPGVGGASGGIYGPGIYDSTYAGRWAYFKESLINDNLKNFILTNFYSNGGGVFSGITSDNVVIGGVNIPYLSTSPPSTTFAYPGGLFSSGQNGRDGVINEAGISGGAGGFGSPGGNGGSSTTTGPSLTGQPGGAGGPGGFGGDGGNGGNGAPGGAVPFGRNGGFGGIGGPGGFGGNGGNGGSAGVPAAPAAAVTSSIGGPGGFGGHGGIGGGNAVPTAAGGTGGPGGFGGGGGIGGPGAVTGGDGGPGGFGGGGGSSPNATAGQGGPGAFIIEWTTNSPNKTGV